MKKIKWVSLAVALLSAGLAFSSAKKSDPCIYARQYWFDGYNYWEIAGQIGYDYACIGTSGICTWYRPYPSQPNYYAPCHFGEFVPDWPALKATKK
jgi:hypothetical protein